MKGRPSADKHQRFESELLFDRLQTSAGSRYSEDSLPAWIEKNTFIAGANYSFKDHEYQLKILSSKKRTQYTKKCSQLGISELKVRRALATAYMIPHIQIMLTMPTAHMAATFTKTRIDPVIRESDLLRNAMDSVKDSTELKGIGTSHLYIRGTYSSTAAISVPVDFLLVDEVDFSDPEVLDKFQSRFTHSKYKWRMETSTPTLPGFGIDERMKASNRHFQMVKCDHCNHTFLPDYREDVVVPGFNGDILDIDKARLHHTRWREAYLKCPSCGKKPDLSQKHRQWVIENNEEDHEADGFQLTPFDGPAFISIQDLMTARTRYKRVADFVNFSLGLCMEDALSGIQVSDLDLMEGVYEGGLAGKVLGIDVGTVCHVTEASIDGGSRVEVDTIHPIDYRVFEAEFDKLVRRVRPIAMVIDAVPYTEMVYRLQKKYPNLYASLYTEFKGMRPFKFVDTEEEKSAALLDDRMLLVNRDIALDALMEDIRANIIGLNPEMAADKLEIYREQMRDMKRVRVEAPKTQPDNERFRWVKSKDGNDHCHHSTLYAWIASKIRLAARPTLYVPNLKLAYSFRQKKSL